MSVYKNDNLEFLKQSVESILKQSFNDFLFYIVIDGSISQPIETYLNNLTDQRVILLVNNNNHGLAYSLNKIINNIIATDVNNPKYLFRMDADDISDLKRFKTQVGFLENNKAISIVGSDCFEINDTGKVIGKRQMPINHKKIIRKMPRHCPLNHPSVAMHFSIFEKGFRYKNELKNTQDYYLWIELAAAEFKFQNLPQKLLFFRRSNNFYERRGLDKALNDHKARELARKSLGLNTPLNFLYAYAVFYIRQSPPTFIHFAYKCLELKRKIQRWLT